MTALDDALFTEVRDFVAGISRMTIDGEVVDGKTYEASGSGAIEVVDNLTLDARALLPRLEATAPAQSTGQWLNGLCRRLCGAS